MSCKRLILCADDFGFNSGVSRAIIELTEMGNLSATSCLVDFEATEIHARDMLALNNLADIGLHLNLTEAPDPASSDSRYRPLGKLMRESLLGRIERQWIIDSIDRQFAEFQRIFGKMPDFVDGHQHVHQFPVIQDVLIECLLKSTGMGHRPYIRVTTPVVGRRFDPLKSTIIENFGTRFFTRKLDHLRWPVNRAFAGIYNFARHIEYPQLMRFWMQNCPDGSIVMCHPGQNTGGEGDSIFTSRITEYNYLRSAEFRDCRQHNGVEVARFRPDLSDG